MILIIGGSGSGKSAYAEQIALRRKNGCALYYLAPMLIYDAEGEKKVERHRELRAGKGFVTIEQPRNIAKAIPKMIAENDGGAATRATGVDRAARGTVLLECISNLVANEMFSADADFTDVTELESGEAGQQETASGEAGQQETASGAAEPREITAETVVDKVTAQIAELSGAVGELIVVTNNVFEDGVCYDESTREYQNALGSINCRLAAMAETVVEVVAGIPAVIKGEMANL